MDPKKMKLHIAQGDWAAIYVDGEFEGQGHESNMYEQALSMLGVEIVYSSDFMRGDLSGKSTAKTVEEIAEYQKDRDERHRLAQQKRLQAEELIKEAARLENMR